ncbi:MAG: flagellar motor protein MotB [Candidatus Obscuribacterales bacterium]|nr:flagellar motor protein MotB [Steroidobacteraceae bacterium]
MSDDQQPIIIKRIAAAHAHHGGSWKVAFADFATAMMAFFLMMWLMGATTADQKGGISQYFQNPSAIAGASPTPSASSMGAGGPSSAILDFGGDLEMYKNPDATPAPEDVNSPDTQQDDASQPEGDKQRLQSLMMDLQEAVEQKEALKQFADHMLMDVTAEGLRIQVIDKESRSMFALGSPSLEPFSTNILKELAAIIATVPNRISISGHTDGRPYNRYNYGNWELSADRANAARRALIDGGLPEDKIGRVVGLSAFAPLDPANRENPINRRISIIVMNQRTEDAIRQESGALFSVQTVEPEKAPASP